MRPLKSGTDTLIQAPPEVVQCPGAAAVHDIQLSQLSPDLFKTILPPVPVFRYVSVLFTLSMINNNFYVYSI